VYGHEHAKNSLIRVICQWINGDISGYCFGFEGPPGVGKTSLAKHGLSNCLKNENGEKRPFHMIQMGGDSNGSSLHGHNYTYVGSSWGSIVQILIDSKCMNPIIFIDEVDKISKTEHGKEITGILTHLLDQTQNDCFQDKYFSGINLDLSKALFILSYNDVESIDRILLDRIHRIKFDNLTLNDKLVICKKHILPEIYDKVGIDSGAIVFDDDILKFIIDEYTAESGVRKLKELLFEIIGDINVNILLNNKEYSKYPLRLTENDIKNHYFKDKNELTITKIPVEDMIGTINGLWANSLGKGGIIPIETSWFPMSEFLRLSLTGMQGDVMKESMHVARTLAWKCTNEEIKQEITKTKGNKDFVHGIHIHCPDGSCPKDGPSAGTAITIAIYSLINNLKIKKDIAITGEIRSNGSVTKIGGLDLKILGGIKAGVKTFLFPKENKKDFDKFIEKYMDDDFIQNINFVMVECIQDVINELF
tara:strand:- start:280 stop:1710 length:1431 start_codon:yes stop_codon:yes gene_type:complete